MLGRSTSVAADQELAEILAELDDAAERIEKAQAAAEELNVEANARLGTWLRARFENAGAAAVAAAEAQLADIRIRSLKRKEQQ